MGRSPASPRDAAQKRTFFSSKRGPRTDAGGAEKGCPAASACSGWRRPEPASGGTFPAGLRPSCTPWRPGTRVRATERVSTNSRALGAAAVAGFRPGAAWRAAPARRDQTNACAGAIAPCGAAVRGAGSALDARAARERAVGTAGALGKARGFCRFCHIFLSYCFLFVVLCIWLVCRATLMVLVFQWCWEVLPACLISLYGVDHRVGDPEARPSTGMRA